MKITLRLLILGLSLILFSCQAKHSEVIEVDRAVEKPTPVDEEKYPTETELSPLDHKRWIEKSYLRLLGMRQLSRKQVEEFMKYPRRDLLHTWIQDPAFSDTVLAFSMGFLGFRQDRIRDENGNYDFSVFEFPQAITAAREILKSDGDILKMFDFSQPTYLEPLFQLGDFNNPPAQEPERLKAINGAIAMVDQELKELAQMENFDSGAACREWLAPEQKLINSIFSIGFGIRVGIHMFFDYSNFDNWLNYLNWACQKPERLTKEKAQKSLERLKVNWESIKPWQKAFNPDVYKVKTVADLKVFSPADISAGSDWLPFGFTQVNALQNSSTNYNRRRAAYVLKHFFCDDLTPINVENPDSHSGGDHGSQTSCYACHYKLDPMAGFFRHYGATFNNFAKMSEIQFDDQAIKNREQYELPWRFPEGSARKWNVGYIRSVSQKHLNSYGDNMEDLFKIIREAPEVRKCLVKRTFEFFSSNQQMIDPGYLEHLSNRFSRQSLKKGSNFAYKTLVREILMSNTFLQRNPKADECYDYAPGNVNKNAPPCQVNFVIQKNCLSCHSSQSNQGGLDLSQWIKLDNEKFGFKHFEAGEQVPTTETFNRVIERLASSDEGLRMPLKMYMSAGDREILYRWAQKQLSAPENKEAQK